MIPALMGKKKTAALVIGMKDGMPEAEDKEEKGDMEMVAEDLLAAVASKDAKAVASALKAAFAIADAMPHEEGEHI